MQIDQVDLLLNYTAAPYLPVSLKNASKKISVFREIKNMLVT